MGNTLYVRSTGTSGNRNPKPCGHTDHHGTCPGCQRAQLAKWAAQLAQATREENGR
jgi:hypothetical protein